MIMLRSALHDCRAGRKPGGWRTVLATAVGSLMASTTLQAQEAPAPQPAAPAAMQAPAPISPEFGMRLLELMVSKGVISRGEADQLVAQASAPPATGQENPVAAGQRQLLAPEPNALVIPYIPESVRRQIKQELRAEMTDNARAEGWLRPDEKLPEWTKRFTLYGDMRIRQEGIFYPGSNLVLGAPVDFNAINQATQPTDINTNPDVNDNVRIPSLNTTQNRQRTRIRLRLGFDAKVTDWITASARIATGNDNAPVGTNQTLGQGGGFSKYQLWVDRASITLKPAEELAINLGRFRNPFWTGEMLFDADVNFDGISISGSHPFGPISLNATAGFFPIFNTGIDESPNSLFKTSSKDKYLVGAQFSAETKIDSGVRAKFAIGYFRFLNIDGQQANCLFSDTYCGSDADRPGFSQFGNTFIGLRYNVQGDLVTPIDTNTDHDYQYFGLASKYHVIDLKGMIEINVMPNIIVRIDGEFMRNIAYDHDDLLNRYVRTTTQPIANNFTDPGTQNDPLDDILYGGRDGWMGQLTFGTPEIRKWKDWSVSVSYRRVNTDATLDAFTDDNFHLGGTNTKGYVIHGRLGIAKGASVALRWASSDVVVGPNYSVDQGFVDLLTEF